MVGWAILKAEVDDFHVLLVAIGCYVWIGILRVYGGREKRKLMCLRKDAIIRRKKKDSTHTMLASVFTHAYGEYPFATDSVRGAETPAFPR